MDTVASTGTFKMIVPVDGDPGETVPGPVVGWGISIGVIVGTGFGGAGSTGTAVGFSSTGMIVGDGLGGAVNPTGFSSTGMIVGDGFGGAVFLTGAGVVCAGSHARTG